MKNLKLILLTICACTFNACEKDFLSLENPNALTEATFWATEDDFNRALASTYGALQYPSVGGAQSSQYESIKSDIARELCLSNEVRYNKFEETAFFSF